jgi:hypothetical protein
MLWTALYCDHIAPNLPSVDQVQVYHNWIKRYAEDPEAALLVRYVGSGNNRRKIFKTRLGGRMIMVDKASAWALHAWVMTRSITSYEMFRDAMAKIPCHFHDVRGKTINLLHWYVAHLYPAKNGNTNWQSWPRAEVKRRFYRALHPCNVFFVPGTRNRKDGESSAVIGFIAQQYAERFRPTWEEFVELAGGHTLPMVPGFGASMALIRGGGARKRGNGHAEEWRSVVIADTDTNHPGR